MREVRRPAAVGEVFREYAEEPGHTETKAAAGVYYHKEEDVESGWKRTSTGTEGGPAEGLQAQRESSRPRRR